MMMVLSMFIGGFNMAAKIIQFPSRWIKEENPTVAGQPEPYEISETVLKNLYCMIELQSDKEVFGRDLKDSNNEPAFYNKTSRGLKKAWKALTDQFDESTRMEDAMQILNANKIRTHQYCMMD